MEWKFTAQQRYAYLDDAVENAIVPRSILHMAMMRLPLHQSEQKKIDSLWHLRGLKLVKDYHDHVWLTERGREALSYLNDGYCWDADLHCPSIDYTYGFYSIVLHNGPTGSDKNYPIFKKLSKRFLDHYEANKEEVDVMIAHANLVF